MKFEDFFKGSDGSPSMSRLLSFLSFFPSTIVMLLVAFTQPTNLVDIFGIYMGGFVLGYVGGRAADAYQSHCQKGQDNGPQ